MNFDHCGNHRCSIENIIRYSSRYPNLFVYEYRVGAISQFYGVQHIVCQGLTANALFEHMSGLERYLSRVEGLRQRVNGTRAPTWAYVHLHGLPTIEILDRLTEICSTRTASDRVYESKFPRLAITMTIMCGYFPYVVTIRSTINGWEESMKLNSLDMRESFAKFQRNIVHIKQQHDITAYISAVISSSADAQLTERETFSLLSEKILAFDKNGGTAENMNTWEAYMGLSGTEVFDFKSFQTNYDQWVIDTFNGGSSTILIGSDSTKKGYKKGKLFMEGEAQKHLNWAKHRVEIMEPLVQQICARKPRKHLPPMYLFLDSRKNRKAADVATLFAFDKSGAESLTNSKWDIITYEVCSATFDKSEYCLIFDASKSSIFRVNSKSNSMFELYIYVRTLLECCKPEAVEKLYELLGSSSFRDYIFGELSVKYQLDYLSQHFSAQGFNTTTWTNRDQKRVDMSALNVELQQIMNELSKLLVVDKEVFIKDGKHRRRTHVKYTVQQLHSDIQTCLRGFHRVQDNMRKCELNKVQVNYFKSRGVEGQFPSFVVTEQVTLGKLIYVLLPDGTLRFCIESQDPTTLTSQRLTHSQIASMGPVLDAGEVFLRMEGSKWIISKINNSSGHYKPSPSDGLQGVEYLLRKMLEGNEYFEVMKPRCSLVNALSTTRLSVVDISNCSAVGVMVDETTQVLGSNF